MRDGKKESQLPGQKSERRKKGKERTTSEKIGVWVLKMAARRGEKGKLIDDLNV